MKKHTKAALLSTFVFPGLGHMILKKYLVGALLAGMAFASLFYLVSKAVERALQISERIQSGEVQLDSTALTDLVSAQASGTEALLLNIATLILVSCWLVGIVDSVRVGRKLQQSSDENE